MNEWIVVTAGDETEVYDNTGKLLSITNRADQTTNLTYDANGFLDAVTDHTGRVLDVNYDISGELVNIIDPDGFEVSYSYDGIDRLAAVRYPDDTSGNSTDNPTRIYHYEDPAYPNALTGITDENGDRFATWVYDASGVPDSSTHAGGAEAIAISYDTGNAVSVTNSLGLSQTFALQAIQGTPRITQIDTVATANVAAMTESYTYDANGYRDLHTDRNGNVTDFDYNSRGLLVSRTDASGTPDARTTTTTWHTDFRVPTQIVKPGQTVDMTYDGSGRMLTRTLTDTQSQSVPYPTAGNTRTWTYTYTGQGLVATIDGPRTDVSDTTTFTYDANGDLQTTTNALGHTTVVLSRDGRGMPTSTQDANGLVTDIAYDARGRLATRTVKSSQGDAITTFTYDGVGQLISIEAPDGSVLEYEYDAAHRLIAIQNTLGERIEYTLDASGNQLGEVIRDESGTLTKTQSQIYDELSRLRSDLGAAGQVYDNGYDDNGNQIDSEDALNRVSQQNFDALDRLIDAIDPDMNTASYDYDERDNLISVVDPRGIKTAYVYDGLDNLIQESSPDAGTTVNVYDAAGNLVQSTDARGVVSTYSYDALNRLTAIEYPGEPSENIAYSYDLGANGVGRLSGFTDISGSTTYSYDDRGNIVEETRLVAATLYVTSYQYDLSDNLIRIVYPSGRVVDYVRDTLSRVQSVTTQKSIGDPVESVVGNLTYQPFGGAAAWIYGNGLNASQDFDLDYRLTAIDIGTAVDRDYGYDTVDNIVGITDQVSANASQTFGYDNLDRLSAATGSYGDLDYGYDPVGNRVSQDREQGTNTINESYGYDSVSNRLLTVARDDNGSITTRVSSYSDAGSLASETRHDGSQFTYTYNARNRLVQVDDGGNSIGSYLHNALGQRVSKTTQNEQLRFVYDLGGRLIAEHDASGEVVREYLYVNGSPIAMVAAGTAGGGSVETLTIDSEDAGVIVNGDWPASTSVAGWLGSNYRVHAPNGSPPGAVVVDNTAATLVGNWNSSTSVAGWEGQDYQIHSPNRPPPGSVLVDNSAGSGSGVWSSSTSAGGYVGANYQHHAPGAGSDLFTWTMPVPADGDYEVFATWTSSNNRASAAPYTINHVDALDQPTSTTLTVDQRSNGGSRQSLGSYRFLAGTTTISLQQSASGYVIADEVSLTPVDALPNRAVWSFTAGNGGDYTISVKWTANANRASNAQYVIDYVDAATGQAQNSEIMANQQLNGAQFNTLATLDLQAGSEVTVTLTDQANGYVVADAVQFLEAANSAPNQVTWPFTITQSGTYEVYARWTNNANRASNASYSVSNGASNTAVTVDQQSNGGGWQLLTTLSLDATHPVEVTLTDVANGYVIADGVELRRQAANDTAEIYYLHHDHLGTPQVVTDASQQVVWQGTYQPFGKVQETVSLIENPLRFPGQYFDVETGLHYNYFRTYDPSVGRYAQSDPIGLAGGMNNYQYVGANPIGNVDPTGLIEWKGRMEYAEGSAIVSALAARFYLESECNELNNKKYRVKVHATSGGATTAPKIFSGKFGFGFVGQRISLEDGHVFADPRRLEGRFAMTGVSAAGTLGLSLGWVRVGDAFSKFGVSVTFGWQTVTVGTVVGTAVLASEPQEIGCGCDGD